MSLRFTDFVWGALTGVAGGVTLAGVLLFRDQLPLSKEVGRVLGLCILYAGMAVFLWAAFYLKGGIGGFVAPRLDHLVVTGPYRIVRHPAYVGMIIVLVGASIVTRSVVGLLLTALFFLPVEIHRARLEERALEEKFQNTWRMYAARTGFFIPYLRRRKLRRIT